MKRKKYLQILLLLLIQNKNTYMLIWSSSSCIAIKSSDKLSQMEIEFSDSQGTALYWETVLGGLQRHLGSISWARFGRICEPQRCVFCWRCCLSAFTEQAILADLREKKIAEDSFNDGSYNSTCKDSGRLFELSLFFSSHLCSLKRWCSKVWINLQRWSSF